MLGEGTLLLRFAIEVALCHRAFLSVSMDQLSGVDRGCGWVLGGSTAALGLKQELLGFRELTLEYEGLAVSVAVLWAATLCTQADAQACLHVLALLREVRLQHIGKLSPGALLQHCDGFVLADALAPLRPCGVGLDSRRPLLGRHEGRSCS